MGQNIVTKKSEFLVFFFVCVPWIPYFYYKVSRSSGGKKASSVPEAAGCDDAQTASSVCFSVVGYVGAPFTGTAWQSHRRSPSGDDGMPTGVPCG